MDSKPGEWQLDVERIWQADAPDWSEAARLADVMARTAAELLLRQAATQALPILRHAALEPADPAITDAARRRLGIIREVLHGLTTPKFGRRDLPVKEPAPEEVHRQLLGLPLDRRLSAPEIHRAYKRAAKSAHPDAGGSAQAFQALSAAREALIAEVRFSRG
ncbi:J domain-containing protein [Bradyrhizobium sp.]|uniref:J domain-containing protein n=1 Tax=Bradyrhizobium sp. TaxID=376 RepID=UPI0027332694|nr:J domain-containing protein [Bradyrhizobium sp.]MDP3691653.1 J domain-containing protein [Bradyrhizobium sp.]